MPQLSVDEIKRQNISIDYKLNSSYSMFSIVAYTVHTILSFYSLMVCLWGYISNIDFLGICKKSIKHGGKLNMAVAQRSQNKDVKKMIFRKQIIYFFILFVLETPKTLYTFALSYYVYQYNNDMTKVS